MTRAEAHLVAQAAEFGPKELGRIGRRILDVVAPEIAEAAEAARLAEQEAHAAQRTRLTMRRLGDGTTRISARVPDAVATRFATYLEAFANPRREGAGATGDGGGDVVVRQAYPKRMGDAFAQFLEAIDPHRLPLHGGDATTVVVTIPLASLLADLAAADLIGAGLVPGDDLTGDRHHRRPGPSARVHREDPPRRPRRRLPPDRPRPSRSASSRPAQRKALLVRDRTCRAEGCDAPGTWCDAHHLDPWHNGGSTDLDNAVLLCSHHHHRIHDAGHRADRLPNGDLRFHRRS